MRPQNNFFLQLILLTVALVVISACTGSKKAFDPARKYSVAQLKEDYELFRNILQERHPSLYWYRSKAEIDRAFDEGHNLIKDSLTEPQFRQVLSKAIAAIGCGHSSIRASKNYTKYADTLRARTIFPLYFKTWNDTVVVTYNLFRKDSLLTRGATVNSIAGKQVADLLDSLRMYLPADGNNIVAKDQRLSTGTQLGAIYTWLNGWPKNFTIGFKDSLGMPHMQSIKPYKPPVDSTKKQQQAKKNSKRKERLLEERSLTIDSSKNFAIMELNSFSEKLALHSFFRRSFRQLNRRKIPALIIDLRSNGGGRINNSNKFLKYLADKPFKLADSLYAVTRKSKYSGFIQNDWSAKWFMHFVTKRKRDGNYHFSWYERHYFRPKKKNHYNGTVYLLIGGGSFSATTLATGILRNQENVMVVGEPTGGAAYGNSALLIPNVTLPNSKVRFRLPLFRLVANINVPKDGLGVLPEVWVTPTVEAIRQARDYKMEKAIELIWQKGGN